MKIQKKALLYDIANMAYLIADNGEPLNHGLHRVRDICQEGNIDRVARILGLAYSDILSVLSPIIISPEIDITKDVSQTPRSYPIEFKDNEDLKYALTTEKKLKIKETSHEYMVSMVLADWLSVTYPPAADVWKYKFETAREHLHDLVAEVTSSATCTFRRSLSPF